MRSIDPGSIPTADLHQYIVGAVTPRPIAFVSTVAPDGTLNLAPYSFFNAFSSNPPIVVFSSNRRVSNNTTKDTLHNIMATKECVVNVVNYAVVHQMAVASVEFDPQIDEFVKSGLTPMPSELVAPPRVQESPIHLECRVQDIVTLGEHGGAGHLVICNIVRIHVSEAVLTEKGRIDPYKLDAVGRLGRTYYTRVQGEAIFTLHQPMEKPTLGFDGLPAAIRYSNRLTGNELGQLAGLVSLPSDSQVAEMMATETVSVLLQQPQASETLYEHAKWLLSKGEAAQAMAILIIAENTRTANN